MDLKPTRRTIFGLLTLVLFLLPGMLSAQNTITLQTEPDPLQPGDVLSITFETSDADDLFYFGFELTYQPSRFAFAGAQTGSLLDLQVADNLASNRIGASAVAVGEAASGEGSLMVLQFQVLPGAGGTTSEFILSEADVRNGDNQPVSFTLPESVEVVTGDGEEPVRPVAFSVDMSVQQNQGDFNPETDEVGVAGGFNGWDTTSGQVFDLNESAEGVYEGTFSIEGEEAEEIEYKYYYVRNGTVFWESDDTGPGEFGNRILSLGPEGELQELPLVFFSNELPPDVSQREVTFSVDMSVQGVLGFFQPGLGDEVAVAGDFNDFGQDLVMEQEPGSEVFNLTVLIEGDEGTGQEYLFRIISGDGRELPNDGFEILGQNRSFTLGPDNEEQVLPEVFFGNRTETVEFVNVSPESVAVEQGETVELSAAIFVDLITTEPAPNPVISAWIGVHDADTDPAGWPESAWFAAGFDQPEGMNHQYVINFAADLQPGVYYYASRFQLADEDFFYGGANEAGGGFWDGSTVTGGELTIEDVVSTEPVEELPKELALHQNYPNPFNPSTQLRFDLPEASDVRLEIYNIQGQRIEVVMSGMREAGTHAVSVDMRTYASGVYLYRMQAGDQVFTRKMMLVK